VVVVQTFCSTPRRFLVCVASLILILICATQAVRAWHLRPTPEKIAAGEALFTHDWQPNDPMCGEGDGLGPVYNATSCVKCHSQGGIGGSGGRDENVLAFQVVPDDTRIKVVSHTVHTAAISEELQESRASVTDLFPVIPNATRVINGCTVRFEDFDPVIFEHVNSPALFGIGLLDDVSNLKISLLNARRMSAKIKREFAGDFSGNGIGFARKLRGGKIGKFGWKGQFATVEEFVASACAMEIGLSNEMSAQPVPQAHHQDASAKPDMTRQQLHELVCFIKSLPAPVQVLPDDELARERVIHGEALFNQVGCSDCHVRDFGNVSGVFTDFHLYSLQDPDIPGSSGYGISREPNDPFRFPNSEPLPDQWKTPPLWGVADSAPYFHDGASLTLESAIGRHKGQAKFSLQQYEELIAEERSQIVEFLKSLRAPTPSM
jgi:CxxC motif-containing protein (DUF1111 family)